MHLFLDENEIGAPSVHRRDVDSYREDGYSFTISQSDERGSRELHLTEAEAVRLAHFILTHANKETTA